MANRRVEAVDVGRFKSLSSPVFPLLAILFCPFLPRFIFAIYLPLWNVSQPVPTHPPPALHPYETNTLAIVALNLLPRLLDSGNFKTVLFQIRRLSHSLTNFDLCSVCLPQFGFLCWNVWFKCTAERLA